MIARYFDHIYFEYPGFFWLFALLPLVVFWYIKFHLSSKASVPLSTIYPTGMGSVKSGLIHLPFVFRLLALSAVITAMAHPQTRFEKETAKGQGIDIVLCIDVSGTMTQRDFQPNRLEAAKKVAADFVKKRRTDRIGVVIFAEDSFTLCPLTSDYDVILSAIASIRNRMLQDGTAIGSGLSTAVDRLRASDSKTKVVLLLTDGENNGGLIDPNTAKEIAKNFGVKVYTIGVGSEGVVPQPVETPEGIVTEYQKVHIDEQLLNEIARETGGKYFRARDNKSLDNIYSEIDLMEKTDFELVKFTQKTDYFYPILLVALGFLLIELVLRYTIFRGFP
jgi:Ca-activated chloride channel family protein